ncbi:hypothetical protein [Zavarzinella formosa]|uniref:hypothetical protein n=1 Tax=Zavarzinella formosa TaxID=360055 RepID=UPI0002EA9BA0|nr:hypothetical protein [Zavarzinella formosa]
MTAPLMADEPYVPSHRVGPNTIDPVEDPLRDRVHRLEEEIGEVRRTVGELAGIVVGEIKDRRSSTGHGGESRFPEGTALPVLGTALKVARQLDRPWLLVDLLGECVTTLRMYLDSRYRIRRGTQLMVPVLFGMFAATYLFFNYFFVFPVISPILERLVEIVLAVLLYKVIGREIGRYRQSIAEYVAAGHAALTLPTQYVHLDAENAGMERQGVE